MSINNLSLYLCSMLLKTCLKTFLLPHLFCNVDFESFLLIEFQNKTNIEILGFQLMHIGFALDSWNRFVRYRFVRYWFRFLSRPWINTDILVNIWLISKTSPRRLQRNNFSSSKTFSSCLEDVLQIRLEDVLKRSWRPTNVCWIYRAFKYAIVTQGS